MAQYPETKESDIFIYEDEGYSGKNTNRPQFQQMIAEEEREPFDFIVIYRLDRISRKMLSHFYSFKKSDKIKSSAIFWLICTKIWLIIIKTKQVILNKQILIKHQ